MGQPLVTPMVQRRRLSMELRRARDGARLTQREVAEELGWSPSKLIRVEAGRVRVSRTDLKALLSLYGLTDEKTIDRLVQLAREAQRMTWGAYRDVLDPEFRIYLDYESSASRIRQYENLFMPGLLQTEEYALQIMQSFPRPDVEPRVIERQLEVRMKRQHLLEQNDIRLEFILDEAVLHRWVGQKPGDCSIMRRQLQRLEDLARRPTLSIQIVPFAHGFYPGLRGPFVLVDFPDQADGELLFVENEKGGIVTKDDAKLLAQYRGHFEALQKTAGPATDLGEVVTKVLDVMGRSH